MNGIEVDGDMHADLVRKCIREEIRQHLPKDILGATAEGSRSVQSSLDAMAPSHDQMVPLPETFIRWSI